MMNMKTEQPKGWANNPIHDMIREAGLDNLERESDPEQMKRKEEPTYNCPPMCNWCNRLHYHNEPCKSEAGLDPVTPLRTAYSRQELADNLKDWMIETWGHPMHLSEESRNRWMERNGLIYHFICDHFPAE